MGRGPGAGASSPAGGVRVRIAVDPSKCQGHARCYGLAPTLFDLDDYGLSTVVGDGTVPSGLEDQARLAVANCPEYAISEVPD